MSDLCTTCEDSGILPEFVGLCDCAAGQASARQAGGTFRVNLDALKRDLEAIGLTPKLHKAHFYPTHVYPMCGYAELDITGDLSGRNEVAHVDQR